MQHQQVFVVSDGHGGMMTIVERDKQTAVIEDGGSDDDHGHGHGQWTQELATTSDVDWINSRPYIYLPASVPYHPVAFLLPQRRFTWFGYCKGVKSKLAVSALCIDIGGDSRPNHVWQARWIPAIVNGSAQILRAGVCYAPVVLQ